MSIGLRHYFCKLCGIDRKIRTTNTVPISADCHTASRMNLANRDIRDAPFRFTCGMSHMNMVNRGEIRNADSCVMRHPEGVKNRDSNQTMTKLDSGLRQNDSGEAGNGKRTGNGFKQLWYAC